MTGRSSQTSLIYSAFNLHVLPAEVKLSPDDADNSISCQQSGDWPVCEDHAVSAINTWAKLLFFLFSPTRAGGSVNTCGKQQENTDVRCVSDWFPSCVHPGPNL